MLAQNFMTAEALGIYDDQLATLIKVLGAFERGEVPPERFSMEMRCCGTVSCILGWADIFSAPNAFVFGPRSASGLRALFLPDHYGFAAARTCRDIATGAAALRNYLTTGDPQWEAVMAEPVSP